MWASEVIAIRDLAAEYGLKVMLVVSGMRRSTYFYRLSHLEMSDAELRLRRETVAIFRENGGYYGHRKITSALGRHGIKVDKKTVARIMREEGLKCAYRPKKFRHYTEAADAVVPNTLNREFRSEEPLRRMTTDVTEFHHLGTKIYLSPVLDFYDRAVVSHQISTAPNTEMVMGMLKKLKERARKAGKSLKGALLHSDQGKLYKARSYIRFIERNGMERSMSNKGNCYDNSVIECFFGNLKTEIGELEQYGSVQALVDRIEQYVEYYNERRIQLRLDGMSPSEYRRSRMCADTI